MTNKSNTFRLPVHQSPAAIAHSFDKEYEPYISLKIDGVFNELKDNKNYNDYYPIFPESWKKIEGELYQDKIFYVFYIEKEEKFDTLEHMYSEIENYFLDSINNEIELISDEIIENDIINNIKLSLSWRNKRTESLIWFPKKYWKLDISNWNNYIIQLDKLFNFVESNEVKSIIYHDGLVISPNKISKNKSLIKLKPRSELTIDLFFNGRKFFSRERTDYSNIIANYDSKKYRPKTIWRLAPNERGKYVPVYEREPGKRPNPDNIIRDILHKYYNYFELKQLLDLNYNPWYGNFYSDGLNEVLPLMQYSQYIINRILPFMNVGNILDIGCGSMGQYHHHFMNPNLTEYVGLDIDLAKLHQSQVKVAYDDRFKFILFDISHKWNLQNERFPNNIWKTYYQNLTNLYKFDNIISIFSSQYANVNDDSWNNYINEINNRSKKNTNLFIMWINCDKSKTDKSKYYKYDKTTNKMEINLPHRDLHIEPGLGNSLIKSFISNNKWKINSIKIELKVDDIPIKEYINLIDWVVLKKT
jgi:hypothetical protein